KHLDECSIASGHYFLPLPPYSPELNPIEQFWATLKRKVTELLKTGCSVQSVLEYCFKTNTHLKSKIATYHLKWIWSVFILLFFEKKTAT
ncbi:transposase, partial [Streptococcus suis]